MSIIDILALAGGAVGLVGGVLGIVSFVQGQRDRAGARGDDARYDSFVRQVRDMLANPEGGFPKSWPVPPDWEGLAARAIRDGHFRRAPDGNGLMLPMPGLRAG